MERPEFKSCPRTQDFFSLNRFGRESFKTAKLGRKHLNSYISVRP